MNKNFLVVNLGSSGSMFLADILNTSEKWTVKHEGIKPHDIDVCGKD